MCSEEAFPETFSHTTTLKCSLSVVTNVLLSSNYYYHEALYIRRARAHSVFPAGVPMIAVLMTPLKHLRGKAIRL